MKGLRQMLFSQRPKAPPAPPVIAPSDRDELEEAREVHKQLLSRSDEAIRKAMEHADAVFYPGPERRRKTR